MDEQYDCELQRNAEYATPKGGNFEITASLESTSSRNTWDQLNSNPTLCSSLNRIPMNISYNVATNTASSAEQDQNVVKLVDNTIGHTYDNSPFSCHNHEVEQTTIVECLLDLDDYLEKMGKDCLKSDNSPLNSKRRSANIWKNIDSTKVTLPFDRCSKLRKTTDGITDTHRNAPGCKTEFIQRTWTNQMVRKIYNQNENQSINSVSSVKTENSSISKNVLTSEMSEDSIADGFVAGKCSSLVLTNEQIFQNLIEQKSNIECHTPRQYGRRAERFSPFASCMRNSTPIFTRIHYENLRPSNMTNTNSAAESFCNRNELYTGSDESTTRTSRNTTPVSVESNTDSGESLTVSENFDTENNTDNQDATQSNNGASSFPSLNFGFNSYWPHEYSRTFALLSCTLGLFNSSRFASLTITYGGKFLIQFLILSIIFGIPFLWLQMSLGAKIGSGPVTMWKISPICLGIGLSIAVVQFFIAIYSVIAVVWLLKIIQDLFIYTSPYAWLEAEYSIEDRKSSYSISNFTENIPFYFNINVLQRMKLLNIDIEPESGIHINNRMAFYLAFVWATVFIILCKGLRSFGKCIILLGALAIVFLVAATAKLLSVVDDGKLQKMFGSSEFDDFLLSSKTWTAAAQETFLTWGLFGASVLSVSSRSYKKSSELTLRRDAVLVAMTTVIGLCLSALIGLCSIQILHEFEFVYVPGSYELQEDSRAIFPLRSLSTANVSSYPTKFIPHYSTLVGEIYKHHSNAKNISGYQVIRFITELLPATLAVCTKEVSWIWALIIFSPFFLFGLGQLCVVWKPVSCALGNSSTAVLLSCVTGLLLGTPFVTEIGIFLVHYMDILFGGAWFIPILWATEILGIFLIRGRPYNGDDLVNNLRMSSSISAFLALSWNVLLPVGLITLAIIDYKTSQSNQFYRWRSKSYFSMWSRKLGSVTQISLLIFVPITAMVQIYRYLSSGPPDILERIQMLYRPFDDDDETNLHAIRNMSSLSNGNNSHYLVERFQNDSPPKYTPPPSYSTATGAKLAKILRQSLRRSIRRILQEPVITRPELPQQDELHPEETACPENNTIEILRESPPNITQSLEFANRSCDYGRSYSLGRKNIFNKKLTSIGRSSQKLCYCPFTAQDVKSILGSSTLGRRRLPQLEQVEPAFRSMETLVQNAEIINMSSSNIADQTKINKDIILGEPAITRPGLSQQDELHSEQAAFPVNNTIKILRESPPNITQSLEFKNSPCDYGRSYSLGRKNIFNKKFIYNGRSSQKLRNRPFTAEDVKSILGSSTLERQRLSQLAQVKPAFRSMETLVPNAEMINLSLSNIADQTEINNVILVTEI